MQTSAEGIAFLEKHEGVVLRAYRCPAGVWTIGAGLTAASGVVTPRAGMTITAAEARRLLSEALRRNYEPRTVRAMSGAAQHEFDAGVSFDFNTGAIHRASWVTAWRARNWSGVREGLMRWTRGGGRVLPGLERRRQEEFRLMAHGEYGPTARAPAAPPKPGIARLALDPDEGQIEVLRTALAGLGFAPGDDPAGIAVAAVRSFQERHGLAVDGVIGRATLATLQREIDARRAALAPIAGVAAGGAETAAEAAPAIVPVAGAEWLGPALIVLAVAVALWLAWRYRDVVAARLHEVAPGLAVRLRSF